MNLVLDELRGLPLVDCRDSALRPISKILSEDIWMIVQSISNKDRPADLPSLICYFHEI